MMTNRRELYEQLVEVENLIGDSGRELRCYLDSLSFEPEQFYETESRLNPDQSSEGQIRRFGRGNPAA